MTFAQERWIDVEAEVLEIAGDHWNEIAVNKEHISLDIDCELYRTLDTGGFLYVTTARDGGKLVGYYISVLRTHPHYKNTLFGFLDSYFVLPEYRSHTIGLDLFEAMESNMKAAGAKCLISGFKLHHDLAVLFNRLGWTAIETMYTKYIGGD